MLTAIQPRSFRGSITRLTKLWIVLSHKALGVVKSFLILSYKVISSEDATPQDWNLMVLIELKNMAALDGLQEKMRAIAGSVIGDEGARKDLAVKRLDIREIVGFKTGRELIFK